MTHQDLVARAVRWLKNTQGCSVVFSEMAPSREVPDAIGWQGSYSILVEVKVSRSDFLKDRDKSWRRVPSIGMGGQRYYFTTPGIASVEEIPECWGLAECRDRHVRTLAKSNGFPHRNRTAEVAFLVSMLRRVQIRLDQDLCEFIKQTPRWPDADAARQVPRDVSPPNWLLEHQLPPISDGRPA